MYSFQEIGQIQPDNVHQFSTYSIGDYANSGNISDFGNFGHQFDYCSPSQMFKQGSYPIDLSIVNIFCPLCGKYVIKQSDYSIFDSKLHNKLFLAHQSCLAKQQSLSMNSIFDEVDQAKIKVGQLKKPQKMLKFGDRQFYTQMIVSHPVSDYKFLKLSNKAPLIGSYLHWQLGQQQQFSNCYLPNIICLPTYDFKLIVFLSQIGANENKAKMQIYINLSKFRHDKNNDTSCIAESQDIKLELRIIQNQKQKDKLIDQMNFKYNYNEKLPMVQFIRIHIRLPQELEEENLYDRNNNINIDDILDQKKSEISESITSNNTFKLFSTQQLTMHSPYSEMLSEGSFQQQKIDLERLIATNQLKAYVSNNTRSRNFQQFLNEATQEQVDLIINNLINDIHELIMHQYANYMVQKLFTICNVNQRLKIMRKLKPNVSDIAKNKQGTHTIQSFIALFVSDQQFKLVIESIQDEYTKLSTHSNATHFIQKIIRLFPIEHTGVLYKITTKNFINFATDKNAMCVMKYQMKRLKEIQLSYPKGSTLEICNELKKQLIRAITLNTDTIIQDSYGNYIVQFCYELFGEQKSSGITDMILTRFAQFSMQKYSHSVVLKCLTNYWTKIQTIEKLRLTLSNEGIIEMYRNRDGNKILLQLMEKYENSTVRDKLFNLLSNCGEATKYYHQRWNSSLGIRTGNVGTQYLDFSDAIKNPSTSSVSGSKGSAKKKYNKHT